MSDYDSLSLSARNQTDVIMTCFFGVDLHKTQFTVYARTENRVESPEQIIQYPATNEGYRNFLKRHDKIVNKQAVM